MFIEGARWDERTRALNSSRPKELFSDLPTIHLMPYLDDGNPSANIYECPLYKVVSRRGTLSTTGHSTNFVMHMELPNNEPDQDTWIKAGVAAFLSLRY
jgi:dynein heavy chain